MNKAQWTIHNIASNLTRYSKYDSEAEAVNAARQHSKTGEYVKIDRDSRTVDFVGYVRL